MNSNMKQVPFEESFTQLQASLQDRAEEVGVRYEAVATHLIDIRNFYIVPLNRYKLLHIMEKPGSIMTNYSMYSTVIYFSPQQDKHVRGKINLVNPDRSCDIFAMDYGTTDAGVTPENIFNLLHPEVEVVPGLAQLCELSMCHPREGTEYTSEAQASFKFFMGQSREALLVTVMEINNQKLSVLVMSSYSNPDDVSAALAYCNHTCFYGGPL